MDGREFLFGSARVVVHQKLGELYTRISFPDAADSEITVNALAFEFTADIEAEKLFFYTANSGHADGATLYCVNINEGKLLWRISNVPPGGEIKIDPVKQLVKAGEPYGTNYDYIVEATYSGEVIDRKYRSGYEMIREANKKLEHGNIKEASSLLEEALATSISDNTKAETYRTLGEIAERTDANSTAIDYYEKAVDLNPKIGVKKRLAKLKSNEK